MKDLILVAHNLRSTHNVGSLLRTADGLGLSKVILTGYTPHPSIPDDTRLPHIRIKIDHQIQKTALGAETYADSWSYVHDVNEVLEAFRKTGYEIAALEQTPRSRALPDFRAPQKLAIVVGREVEGLEPEILQQCDYSLEIPMLGKKESFNVVQAAAMALYHCRYRS